MHSREVMAATRETAVSHGAPPMPSNVLECAVCIFSGGAVQGLIPDKPREETRHGMIPDTPLRSEHAMRYQCTFVRRTVHLRKTLCLHEVFSHAAIQRKPMKALRPLAHENMLARMPWACSRIGLAFLWGSAWVQSVRCQTFQSASAFALPSAEQSVFTEKK